MLIIAIIGLIVMSFILGFILGEPSDSSSLCWDYDIKSGKISSLETRIYLLEEENRRLNFINSSYGLKRRLFEEEYMAHCHSCNRIIRSKDFKDKEVAELLNKITLSSQEIAKKLNMDISNN